MTALMQIPEHLFGNTGILQMKINFPSSLGFTFQPTPIVRLHDRAETGLWLKRDDLTGMELSGNKIRKLDFLVREALDQGADGIITCGGLQSNHCRAAAFVGARLGLQTVLFLRGEAEKNPTGNYFLDRLSGATIIHVTAEEYKNIGEIMAEKSAEFSRAGKKMYVIPEGGSNETGSWGYCQCFVEAEAQIKADKMPIEAIAVASGSGGTHAGLLIGKKLTESNIDIFSINVCDDSEYFKNKISAIIAQFNRKYGYRIQLDPG
ncbi:MAG: pyridoxal-phosphate dependent enzyme, partial [Calditrichales bacterium]